MLGIKIIIKIILCIDSYSQFDYFVSINRTQEANAKGEHE